MTSQVKKDKYQDLLEKKKGKGFPYVVWMDQDGNVVCGTDNWHFQDAGRAITGLDETGKRAKWFMDVKKKAAGGGNPEKIDLLLAEVEMERTKLADAEKRLADMGALTDEQKTMVEALRVKDEVKPTIDKFREKGSRYEELLEAGKTFAAIRKASRPGPPAWPELEFFWRCILLHASKEKDAAAFEDALKPLKARFGDSTASSVYFHTGAETWKGFLEAQEKTLEQLKAATKPAGEK